MSQKRPSMRYEEAVAVLQRKQEREESMISQTVEPRPNDYLRFTCLVMLCCNLPLGIIALYFSRELMGFIS